MRGDRLPLATSAAWVIESGPIPRMEGVMYVTLSLLQARGDLDSLIIRKKCLMNRIYVSLPFSSSKLASGSGECQDLHISNCNARTVRYGSPTVGQQRKSLSCFRSFLFLLP